MIDPSKAAENKRARDERKQAHLRGIMDRYVERFRAAANGDALSVAREAHAAIEAVLDRDRAKSPESGAIQCRKGCSHCCHGPVEISPHEAVLLVEAAREADVEVDRTRLERQSRQTVDSWRQQPAADRACIFLGGDGACRVYASRPGACRKLLVTSAPDLCDPQGQPANAVDRWYSWEAEVLQSAALEVFGVGLMPVLLLAEVESNKGT